MYSYISQLPLLIYIYINGKTRILVNKSLKIEEIPKFTYLGRGIIESDLTNVVIRLEENKQKQLLKQKEIEENKKIELCLEELKKGLKC